MDELLLEASETFKMTQTTSPDSCALLPTTPSSVDLLTLISTRNSFTQFESESVFECAKVYCDVITKCLTLAILINQASLVYK